jgi:hypothetical protein
MTKQDWYATYDSTGRAHLVTTSLDTDFVVSAYIEHGTCTRWHFGYNRHEQDAIAELILTDPSLRRAILITWYDAVDPFDPLMEGHRPVVDLDLLIDGPIGWAKFATAEHEAGQTVNLITAGNRAVPSPVRLGREIYADQPFLSAERIRAVGAEYLRTGHQPDSVAWQRRTSLVPQGPFGRQIVAEDDLPPSLELVHPKQAQPWAHDPPPLLV